MHALHLAYAKFNSIGSFAEYACKLKKLLAMQVVY